MPETPNPRRDGPKPSLKELDKIEKEMVMGRSERREFAGDPKQPRRLWVRTRNKSV